MDRPSRAVLLLLLLLLSSVVGLWWLDSGQAARDASPAVAAQEAPSPTTVAALPLLHGTRTEVVEVPRRVALPPLAASCPPLGARTALVRVRGQVFRSGQPLGGCELSFHFADRQPISKEIDWDFTDRSGRYEVELPAARYVVCSEDDGSWTGAMQVPEHREEIVVDFHLP